MRSSRCSSGCRAWSWSTQVVLHPADPLTGKRGEATDRIDLEAPSLVFSFDHRVRVIGDDTSNSRL